VISVAQKPGLFSYWITRHNHTDLGGRIFSENYDVRGPGRFTPINLADIWDLPFLKVFKDGDHLCALAGDNLQEGTAEFAPLTDGNLLDQVTDLMLAYQKAHPEHKTAGRCDYWEPHEIEFMARQARARRAM